MLVGLRELEAASGIALVAPVVAMFCRDSSLSLSAVQAAVQAGETGAALLALHKVRGSPANVGASRLANVCRQFETQSERGRDQRHLELLAQQLANELACAQHALGAVTAAN